MQPPEETTDAGLAARIVPCLIDLAREVRVRDVRIGLGYTAVMLETGQTGVAYTFRDLARGGCSVFRGIRPLVSRSAADLLPLLQSADVIEAGVGLACANALANRDHDDYLDGDVLDHLGLTDRDRVGMVGHFGPLVGPIQRRAGSLTIFERVDRPSGLLRPQQEAEGALPGCQVALITATSVINRTADRLIEAAVGCREVVLLGASTPLLPKALGNKRVTMLSGVVVVDGEAILRVVSEGGGMRHFGPFIRKVTLRVSIDRPIATRSMK
ncbi:MAG: DUF364 domain-containing protein [Bradymonadales bacterium]|nr:DUF364 domain-containing protein [Bradymonadales bacterium]